MERAAIREIGQGLVAILDNNRPSTSIFSTTGIVLSWLFGNWDLPLQILLAAITIDYTTGLLRAKSKKEISSDVGLNGLLRKAGIILVLILAVLLDRLLENDTWVIRTYVSYFFIANEGISIVENCASLGVPIPDKVVAVLQQLKDGEKKGRS